MDSEIILDLAYDEDSRASPDMNVVITETGRIEEIQPAAERLPFTYDVFNNMFELARTEINHIIELQTTILK